MRLVLGERMRWSLFLLIGLSFSQLSRAKDNHRTIPAEVFWQAGFPWLAEGALENPEPFEMPVYQLSCASCLESFTAILKGEEDPAALFFLNTAQPEDREVAHAMIAAVLAQPNAQEQRRVFRELLDAYLAAPELYLNDLPQWWQTCQKAWGKDQFLPMIRSPGRRP